MNLWPGKFHGILASWITLDKKLALTLRRMNDPLLLKILSHLRRQTIEDANLRVWIQSKTMVMRKPIRNTQMNTLPTGTHDDRAPLTTAWVLVFGFN